MQHSRPGFLSVLWLSPPCQGWGSTLQFVAVEALKVRFDQAPLPLSACPIPEEAVADTSVAYVFTEDLCTTYVGIRGSAQ